MKLNAQQLRVLIENVIKEVIDPSATMFVQNMSDSIRALVEEKIESMKKRGDALLKTRLTNFEEEVAEAAFGRLSSLIEKVVNDNLETAIYDGVNAQIDGNADEEPYPADYEACDECGYDHSYEYEQAAKVHKSLGKA